MTSPRPGPPRSTYRVQLHAGFTLDDAAAVVPYLARLGISHLYTSPLLQAAPGSMHGYDVVDHGRVSDELGGEPAFLRLVEELRRNGMGLVVDIVPNHMAIGEQNRWWWDVLQHGQASRFARWFDVDWDPPESRLRNVILLPVLPDHYGRVLESGGIRLRRQGGQLLVEHGDRRFPLDPRSIGPIASAAASAIGSDELAFIGSALADLPPATSSEPEAVARRQRDSEVLGERLEELVAKPEVGRALDAELAAIGAVADRLDALLEEQSYRLALWRAAARDLGYRRFFDIDELIGLRMEDEVVFRETHRLILRWLDDGLVDGIRIDHPDGLRDPAGYFARLRAAAPGAWIVAEKILEADEPLPADWPIDGTTGYGFANLATGLLVDPEAEGPMDRLWASIGGPPADWPSIADQSREEVLESVLGSDVNRLTDLFVSVCETHRRYRDFTRHELHDALREVARRLPVYRTYVRADPRHVSDRDAGLIRSAAAAAAGERPDLDPELFDLLAAVLRLEVGGVPAAELALRFQQLTPAAMAKGVEDTAFYRHHRLVALNEVGGNPGRFGVGPAEFHERMTAAQAEWPAGMLALTTHDTKRSADVRARLAVVSQDPDGWIDAVGRLRALARPHRVSDDLPSAPDEYLFLQTVVGAWPIEADRAAAYLEKASREAKLRTSWTAPDGEYDAALATLVRGCLGDARFRAEVDAVVEDILDDGRVAALTQLALQLTAPGIPDVYQGGELWDLSLVDPDNRRPVDYAGRREALEAVEAADAETAWACRADGLAKLWLLRRGLMIRNAHPEAFGPAGAYRPLPVRGRHAERVVAFARGEAAVTVVPRFVRGMARGWADTAVELPAGRWRGLDGAIHEGATDVGGLLASFPVALLEAAA